MTGNKNRYLALILFSGIGLTACVTPGEGPTAKRVFAEQQPVIRGLSKYYQDTGSYPDKLEDLTPKYFTCAPPHMKYENRSTALCDQVEGLEERCYGSEAGKIDRYTFQTAYYEKGLIRCLYDSAADDWQCWKP